MNIARAGALLLLGCMPCAAGAQVIFSDDFADGDDADWLRADFIGSTTYSVTGGRYQMATPPLPPLDTFAFAGSAVIASAFDPSFANGVFRASVRMDNEQTNAAMVARANLMGTAGYGFLLNNANPAQSFIGIGALDNLIAVETFAMPLVAGVEYIMEGTLFGTALSLKVWEAGSAEPAEPQVRWNDSAYSMGLIGVAVLNQPVQAGGSGGVLSASFDDVSFTIPAPIVTPLLLVMGPVACRGMRRRYVGG